LFTSDEHKTWIVKTIRTYIAASLFCAFFGAVYELFSHGVYSYFMIYAFAIPLALGALPLSAMLAGGRALPDRIALGLWNCGIAALTVGCAFKGVLDIYGTTNRLIVVYPVCGGVLLAAGLLFYLIDSRKSAVKTVQEQAQ